MRAVHVTPRLTDEPGLIEIEHNLGTMRVTVVLFGADGMVVTARMVTPVDSDLVEAVVMEQVVTAVVSEALDGKGTRT